MDYITPFLPMLVEIAALALITLIGWVVTTYVRPWLGAKTAAELIEVLDKAIDSGIASAQAHGLEVGAETFAAHVLTYVRQSVPDTLAKISPLPDALDRKIAASIIKAVNNQNWAERLNPAR